MIAGQIDGPDGRTAVFGRLDQLRVADPIVVHDPRSNLHVHFSITATQDYTLAEAATPEHWSACTGFRNGTHDHRLAVYAVRTG